MIVYVMEQRRKRSADPEQQGIYDEFLFVQK